MSDKVIKQFENEMKDFRDRLTILETKMDSLEKTHQELKRTTETLFEFVNVAASTLDIDSCIRDFMFIAERTSVEIIHALIGTYLKNIKEFGDKYDKPPYKELISQYIKTWMSVIFVVASVKRIEFDDFASIVIENLGSDLAKKTIALEDVVKFYGAENASTWKKLIE